jgi:hypothetical protein
VLHEVPRDERQALLGADDGLELRPLALELLLSLDLLAFGYLLELGIDPRLLGFVKAQLGEPAFLVDRDGRLVLHGALNVVNTDVVAENLAGALVLKLDGCAGEANEGGVRQRVAKVRREAVCLYTSL